MEWISVEDRLPDKGVVCLLYQTYPEDSMFHCRADPFCRNFTKIGGIRYDGKFVSYEDQYSDEGLKHISHWMPLPTPPKEKIPRKTECEEMGHMNTWMPKNQTLCMRCGAVNDL